MMISRIRLLLSGTITQPDTFKRIVDNVLPIIKVKGTKLAVIVPPLPRHIFGRCCSDPEHCSNAGETSFQKDLLQGFVHLRTNLIRLLVTQGITNFKVMDSCCMTNCATTADTEERINNLRKITAKDGVHFVDEGYRNLATRCLDCLNNLTGRVEVKPLKDGKPTVFFWRGFKSRRGLVTARSVHGTSFHPTGGTSRNLGRGRGAALRGRSRGRGGHWHSRPGAYHPYRR